MGKDDFIQHLLKNMGNDAFGRARLRHKDRDQWRQACKEEERRLASLGYCELELLYQESQGLYELAE